MKFLGTALRKACADESRLPMQSTAFGVFRPVVRTDSAFARLPGCARGAIWREQGQITLETTLDCSRKARMPTEGDTCENHATLQPGERPHSPNSFISVTFSAFLGHLFTGWDYLFPRHARWAAGRKRARPRSGWRSQTVERNLECGKTPREGARDLGRPLLFGGRGNPPAGRERK